MTWQVEPLERGLIGDIKGRGRSASNPKLQKREEPHEERSKYSKYTKDGLAEGGGEKESRK